MSTQPTDAEIDALNDQFLWNTTEGRRCTARAVLAKWGSPVVAGEPVGWMWQHEETGRTGFVDCWQVENRWQENNLRLRLVSKLYTTPQPTQAQAGAVPLTCEWTHNDDDGFWETACGEAWRFDDGGPAENSMHFCHSCGKSLCIKGGQHGAT